MRASHVCFALLAPLLACGRTATEKPTTEKSTTEKSTTEKSTTEKTAQHATRIDVTAPAAGAAWQSPETEVMESQPVQFALSLTKEMPSPGYKFEVDVTPADTSGTIVARVEQVAPGGVGLTVMAPARVRVPLGSLQPGSYRLELHVRDGKTGDFTKQQVVQVTAK